ncbi:MAG: ABC transporter permease [Armatimonadota bacterium]
MATATERLPVTPPRSARRKALSLAIVAGIIVLWEAAKIVFNIPTYMLPHVHEVLGEFFRRGGRGELWAVIVAHNAAYTAWSAFTGFVVGGAAGLALAIIFSQSRLLERGLLPYVIASQTVPILAIAPMVVVWLGTSWVSKTVIAAYLTFFPVTINMLRGFKSVDTDALALMRSLAATRWQVFTKLQFPAALPYLFTALRISATASVIGAIVGELPVGSRYGMGVVIINGAQYYNWRPGSLWAAILVSALIGIAFYHTVAAVERRVVRWHPAAAGEQA